jgi:hypothetical protein
VTSIAFRRSAVIALIMTASCAGDFVNHRLEHFPASEPTRLDVRDSSGAVVKTIDAPATIKAFDSAVNQIDRWFDDIFNASGAPQYTVELVRNEDVSVGRLSISAKYVRHEPGKYAAKITQREREQLLRILGLR